MAASRDHVAPDASCVSEARRLYTLDILRGAYYSAVLPRTAPLILGGSHELAKPEEGTV
jgi:hypothetical protein